MYRVVIVVTLLITACSPAVITLEHEVEHQNRERVESHTSTMGVEWKVK